jgi:hypothetical protein
MLRWRSRINGRTPWALRDLDPQTGQRPFCERGFAAGYSLETEFAKPFLAIARG